MDKTLPYPLVAQHWLPTTDQQNQGETMANYRRVAQLRTAEKFRKHLEEIGVTLEFDEEMQSGAEAPLTQSLQVNGRTLSKPLCGSTDGRVGWHR